MVTKKVDTFTVNSLGTAQAKLETATVEHIAAQAAYVKASERLTQAEEAYTTAMTALVNEVSTLRDKCKVPNLVLRG